MPSPRFARLDAERQQTVLDAAAAEFFEHGYQGASLNRIIETAGASKGAFYYWFENKADLFATVLERLVGELSPSAYGIDLDALTPATFWPAWVGYMRQAAQDHAGKAEMTRLGRDLHALLESDEAPALQERVAALADGMIGPLICRGQALGVVRADLPAELLVRLTQVIDMTLDRWFIETFGGDGDTLTAEQIDRLVAIYSDIYRRLWETRPTGDG